jgi:hypothetical protein
MIFTRHEHPLYIFFVYSCLRTRNQETQTDEWRYSIGGPFEIYSSTTEKLQEPKRAQIKFQTKDIRSHVSVLGIKENKNTGNKRSRGPASKYYCWNMA